MNVSRIRHHLKRGEIPRVELLKPGEPIEAGNIVVCDSWCESPSDTSVGQPCGPKETILRLVFEK